LDGLRRLTVENDNRFTRVASAEEAIVTMRDLASPVGAFVRERCELGSDKQVDVDLLYNTYKLWAEDNGHERKSKALFGRDLRAVSPSIRKARLWGGGEREMVYTGMGLRTEKG
jgi:putative DNA primase/helicase